MRTLQEMISKGLQPDKRTMSNMVFAYSWGSIEEMRRSASPRCNAHGSRCSTTAPDLSQAGVTGCVS